MSVTNYIAALRALGFSGTMDTHLASRITASTDNSVYQFLPDLVLHPKTESDIVHAVTMAKTHHLPITPRGGGTGTNGQSLNHGIVLDLSTHMRQILAIDLASQTAAVAPGVVLDQLNQALSGHGYFFAPHVSTSSRATIGGMVSTDASGKGSRIYGRTSDHIVALRAVMADGNVVIFGQSALPGFGDTAAIDRGLQLLATLRAWAHQYADDIATLPQLSRSFTGYNLTALLAENPSMLPLICGSEGTLCIVTQIAVQIQPLPEHQTLVLLHYPTMPLAMQDVSRVLEYQPTAIESIDEHTLSLGRQDSAYPPVAHLFQNSGAVHLVGFSGHHDRVMAAAQTLAAASEDLGIPSHCVTDPQQQQQCWNLRKRAVGLLLRLPGRAKPVAFIEDSVVPPQHLAAYIQDLRTLLDAHGLFYAMYGHADVGCVHVRPALDLQNPAHKALFATLSDQVYALVNVYGGLIWGEHGKGLRGHYTANQIGPELHRLMRRIKTLFDPENMLNPGKLYVPFARRSRAKGTKNHFKGFRPVNPIRTTLYPLNSPMKADRDRDIPEALQSAHAALIACNGNGACFSINQADKMCPSFKATHNRIDSPKGRAGLLKEWLRSQAVPADYPTTFVDDIKDTLDRCLSCKGCTLTCPAQVDIPETRSLFLEQYYRHNRRPLRDPMFAMMETLMPWMANFPSVSNRLMSTSFSRSLLSRLGISDAPKFKGRLTRLAPPKNPPTVIVIPDIFSHYLDPDIGQKAHEILTALGETVLTLPFIPHGKAQHVLGMRRSARKIAARQYAQIAAAQRQYGDIPIVVIEPGIASMYRHEYPALLACSTPKVQGGDWGRSPQNIHGLGAFLATHHLNAPLWQTIAQTTVATQTQIFPHCMDTDTETQSWVKVLAACGHQTTVTQAGCCGMAGLFGHQAEQKNLSQKIFDMAWRPTLDAHTQPLATGYSCRSQIRRFTTNAATHPIAVIYGGLATLV